MRHCARKPCPRLALEVLEARTLFATDPTVALLPVGPIQWFTSSDPSSPPVATTTAGGSNVPLDVAPLVTLPRTNRGDLTPAVPTDWYRFVVARASTLRAELRSEAGHVAAGGRLSLTDESGRVLATSEGVAGNVLGGRISQHLTPGTYHLAVTAPTGSLAYTLEASLTTAPSPLDPLPTGQNPRAVVSGDFNGDHLTDLATVNADDDTLTVLLGNGDGTFRPALPVATGVTGETDRPVAVAAADLNRDSFLDLVSANSWTGTLSVLRGAGDGTFAASDRLPIGGEPSAVVIADLDGDGLLDLVAADRLNNRLVVLRQDDVGRFLPAGRHDVGFEPVAVAAADVTGDGTVDLVCASYQDRRVTVLPGDGRGQFGAGVDYEVGDGPTALVVADVNGDGRNDILTANQVGDSIGVLLGRADGSLAVSGFAAGVQPVALAVGDVNGDTLPDVVAGAANGLQMFLGDGQGRFSLFDTYEVRGGPAAVQLADVTGDGVPDVVYPGSRIDRLAVLPGNGDGTFQAEEGFIAGDEPVSVVTADFDLDNRPDVVTANASADTLTVLLGNGDGTFQPRRQVVSGRRPVAVATGDFNGDGRPDLVSVNRLGAGLSVGTLTVLLGNGAGGFLSVGEYAVGRDPVAVAVADINRDGALDLVAANRSDNTLSVYRGTGTGAFDPLPRVLPVGRMPYAVIAADLDRDGLVDLATANRLSHTVSIYRGLGDGTFERRPDLAVGTLPVGLAAGDLDGDGTIDLATSNLAGTVTLLLGRPGGAFERQSPDLPVGGEPYALLLADFDGDRRIDLITADNEDGTISVLRGNGDGTFLPRFTVPAGEGPVHLATADLDADGRLDVVTVNSQDNTVSVLLGPFADGAAVTSAAPILEAALRATPFLLDVNGDGRLDSLIRGRNGEILYRQGMPDEELPLGFFQVVNPGHAVRDFVPVRTAEGWAIAAIDAATDADPTVRSRVSLYFPPDPGGINWRRQERFASPYQALRITAADLTGSGRDSLILTNPANGNVSLALAADLPDRYRPFVHRATGGSPTDVAVADVDGDRDLDLLVSHVGSGDVALLENDPARRFDHLRRFRAGPGWYGLDRGEVTSLHQPVAVIAGALQANGQPAVVVLNQGTRSLSTLVNNGRGGLLTPGDSGLLSPTTAGSAALNAPGAMVAYDLEGDGTLDLAVLDRVAGQVFVYLGRGDGTFRFVAANPAGDSPLGLTVHIDPDTGQRNLLIGNASGDILQLVGNGDGTFAPPPPGSRASLAILETGGQPLVVVANQQANRVTVQTPTGQPGRYAVATALPLDLANVQAAGAVTRARLDSDRFADVIVLGTASNNVVVYRRTGATTFAAPVSYSVGTRPVAVTVSDLNADAVPDLIVTNQGSNNVTVLFGRSTSDGWTTAFALNVPSGGYGPLGTAVRDVTADGTPDLVITNAASEAGSSHGSVTVATSTGLGFFRPATNAIQLPSIPTAPFLPVVRSVVPDVTGRLLGIDLTTMSSLGVVYQGQVGVSAVAPLGGRLVAALRDGSVQLLDGDAGGMYAFTTELTGLTGLPSEPSALAVLETESGFQVLVTSSGSDRLFTFDLPSADGVTIAAPASQVPIIADTSSLDGRSLVVVVTLLAGGLTEGSTLASVPAPGEDEPLTFPITAGETEGSEVSSSPAEPESTAVGPEEDALPNLPPEPPPEEQPFDEAAQTALPQVPTEPPTGEDTPATGEAEMARRCARTAEPAAFPGPQEDTSRNLTWLDAAFQDVGLGWQEETSSDADEANPGYAACHDRWLALTAVALAWWTVYTLAESSRTALNERQRYDSLDGVPRTPVPPESAAF